ncbi:DDX60 [Symbiodinium microadriaticum]|nr:DDX60 [Symbiodinium microadriaticum]
MDDGSSDSDAESKAEDESSDSGDQSCQSGADDVVTDTAAMQELADATCSKTRILPQPEKLASVLTKWHDSVRCIGIDILSCLGSAAATLIDGTALFRQVGSDLLVDWMHGGQVLHAVYLAEKLLSHIVEKDVSVCLFFFEEDWTSLPLSLQRLLWLVLCDHFQRASSSNRADEVPVSRIRTVLLPGSFLNKQGRDSFEKLVLRCTPSCVITDFGRPAPLTPHCGREASQEALSFETLETEFPGLRSCLFVHWLHSLDLQVLDIESLDVAGPRFIGNLLEPVLSPQRRAKMLPKLISILSKSTQEYAVWKTTLDDSSRMETSIRLASGRLALKRLLGHAFETGREASIPTLIPLSAAFTWSLAALEVFTLDARRVSDADLPCLPDALGVPRFLLQLHDALSEAILCIRQSHPDAFDGTSADLFDGRVFHRLAWECLQTDDVDAVCKRNPFSTDLSSALELASRVWSDNAPDGTGSLMNALHGLRGLAPAFQPEPRESCKESPEMGELVSVAGPSSILGDGPSIWEGQRDLMQGAKEQSAMLVFPSIWQGAPLARLAVADLLQQVDGDGSLPDRSVLPAYQPHHYHAGTPLEVEPDAYQAALAVLKSTRVLRLDAPTKMSILLQFLTDDGVVRVHKDRKVPRWMYQVRTKFVEFRLQSFTDSSRSDEPLKDLAELKVLLSAAQYPVTLNFNMAMSQAAVDRRGHQAAAKNQHFLESLLEGSPVTRQTIVTGSSPDDARRKETASSPGKKGSPQRSADRVRQQTSAAQQDKLLKQKAEQVKQLIEDLKATPQSGNRTKAVESFASSLRRCWEEGAKAPALKGIKHWLKESDAWLA